MLMKRREIVAVGHSHKYWQSAFAEGRRMAREELAARKAANKI
jgi:hypothetical protein